MNDPPETPHQYLLRSERDIRIAMRQATSIHFLNSRHRMEFLALCNRGLAAIRKAKEMLDEHDAHPSAVQGL